MLTSRSHSASVGGGPGTAVAWGAADALLEAFDTGRGMAVTEGSALDAVGGSSDDGSALAELLGAALAEPVGAAVATLLELGSAVAAGGAGAGRVMNAHTPAPAPASTHAANTGAAHA